MTVRVQLDSFHQETLPHLRELLEANRGEYYARLRALNGIDAWDRWIAFFLGALAEQAHLNTEKANGILELYARLKRELLALTRSQYAVPLLDHLFHQPIFAPRYLLAFEDMPSKPMVMELIRRLRQAEILTTLRQASGRRGQILALSELVNLCEGRKVV